MRSVALSGLGDLLSGWRDQRHHVSEEDAVASTKPVAVASVLLTENGAAAKTGSNYVIPWTAEGNASTRFKFVKNGKTYQLLTATVGGAWTETSTYTFAGDDPLGRGPFLVGVQIGDPNLATLPQIAPITLRVNCKTATQIVVR